MATPMTQNESEVLNRKMHIMVFDTETTSIEKPFCYNVGYTIFNTDTAEKVIKRDFVVEQVWHNPMLFTTAYYADKREIYVNRMKSRKCLMDKWGYIMRQMRSDIKAFEIEHAYAFNSPFDKGVFEYNCDWFKTLNPFDDVQLHDIRGYVHRFLAFTTDYKKFCDDNKRYTEGGNYSTTAETVFQYITQNTEFVEEHTALADSEIECDILAECIKRGAEWNEDYKVYQSIPREEMREFVVVDTEGNKHLFPFARKRKMSNAEGVRLYAPKGAN